MTTDTRLPDEDRARLLAEAQAAIDPAALERRVTIETSEEGYPIVAVTYHGEGLDRTDGWRGSMGPAKTAPALARRMVAAVNAGIMFDTPEVGVDVYGQTYVHARARFLTRTLNADLRKVGF